MFINKKTGARMTLYHPPANGLDVDRTLRYEILEYPAGHKSAISELDARATIEATPSPADWLDRMVPASAIPPHKQ